MATLTFPWHTLLFTGLALTAFGSTAADKPAIDPAALLRQALELQRDLLLLEEQRQVPTGQPGLLLYLNVDNAPQLSLRSITVTLDNQTVLQRDIDKAEQQALAKGGIERLAFLPVAAGHHELRVLVRGTIGHENQQTKTLAFTKGPGLDYIKITLDDVLQLRKPEIVFRHEQITAN